MDGRFNGDDDDTMFQNATLPIWDGLPALEKGLTLHPGSENNTISKGTLHVGLKVCFSIVSIVSGAVISQWKSPDSSKAIGGLISLILRTLSWVRWSTLDEQGHRWFLDPKPDILVGSIALWGISTIGLRKLCQDDRYNDCAIAAGAIIGIVTNVFSWVAREDLTSFGSYVMVGISVCMALGMIVHATVGSRDKVSW